MTVLEEQILGTIQDDFPLEERPYQVLAEKLDSTEKDVFDAGEGLRTSGIIRRIGGVYDSKALGFISRLCAGKVSDSALEDFAAVVNQIPAITHNYVRSHEYNVWFTVIAQSEDEIHKIVDEICAKTELHEVHVLLATKKFKINTVMGATTAPVIRKSVCVRSKPMAGADRARIRIACDDIPHTLTPFKDWNVSTKELREDLDLRRMRRFGAILRHQDAGFAYNAMVCFESTEFVGSDLELSSCGDILANNPHVSHCYERPAFEGFPYKLYAMMHAPSAEALESYIKEAAESIGNPAYVVLHSVRELKKTSFKFFA